MPWPRRRRPRPTSGGARAACRPGGQPGDRGGCPGGDRLLPRRRTTWWSIVLRPRLHRRAGGALPAALRRRRGRGRVEDVLDRLHQLAELSAWLGGVDAGEIAMVVNACHSAAAIEEPGFKPGPLGGRGLGQLAYDKGMRSAGPSQADDVALKSSPEKTGPADLALVRDGLEQRRAARTQDYAGWPAVVRGGECAVALPRGARGRGQGRRRGGGDNVGCGAPKRGTRIACAKPELFDYDRNKTEVLLFM